MDVMVPCPLCSRLQYLRAMQFPHVHILAAVCGHHIPCRRNRLSCHELSTEVNQGNEV